MTLLDRVALACLVLLLAIGVAAERAIVPSMIATLMIGALMLLRNRRLQQ
jgi:hypothetical protein